MGVKKLLGMGAVLCSILLFAGSALATWSVYEYRDSDGKYRYGVKNGNDEIKLGLGKRKQAEKTASELNEADAIDRKETEK